MISPRSLLLLLSAVLLALPATTQDSEQGKTLDPKVKDAWQRYVQAPRGEARAALLALGASGMEAALRALTGEDRRARAMAMRVLPAFGEAAIPRLARLWRHGDRAERVSAEFVLQKLGRPAMQVFMRHLPNMETRPAAVAALRRFGEDALVVLRTQLDSKKEFVRAAALLALGVLGDRDSYPRILGGLRQGTPAEQEAAAEALGALRDEHAIPELGGALMGSQNPSIRRRCAEALAQFGERALPVFTQALRSGEVGAASAVVPFLRLLGEKGMQLLGESLSSTEWRVRAEALRSLRDIGPQAKEWEDKIAALLEDELPAVEMAAIQACAVLGKVKPATLRVLIDKLELNLLFRANATKTLAVLQNEGIAEALVQRMMDGLPMDLAENQDLVEAIIARGERALPFVVAELEKGADVAHRQMLAFTLQGLGPKAHPWIARLLMDDEDGVRTAALESAKRVGRAMHPALVAQIAEAGDKSIAILLRAAGVLPPDPEIWIPELAKLRVHPDWRVRELSARLLESSAFAGEAVAQTLAVLLEDETARVRHAAADTVSQRPEDFAELLGKAVRSEDPQLRYAAARALSKQGEKRLALLRVLAKDADERVRGESARGLAQVETPGDGILQLLTEMLADRSNRVRSAARRALVGFGIQARPALLRALGGTDWRQRYQAAEAFARHPELVNDDVRERVRKQLDQEKSGLVKRILGEIVKR
jgi:HEAT repeat protein